MKTITAPAVAATIDPYYVAHAWVEFAQCGGDPELSFALAAWAEHADHLTKRPHGVLVGENGHLYGETVHVSSPGVNATYLSNAYNKRWRLFGNTLDLACAQVGRRVGQTVMHIALSRFTGPSPVNVTFQKD